MPVAAVFAPSSKFSRGAACLVALGLLLSALLPFAALAQEVPELQITSTNYILIDADTGEIYAQRGAHERRAPASLTKIFTAIETIEEAPPGVEITTAEADLVSEFASQVGFSPGETFTVEELLYGMMLPSGNDAARALARGLGAEPGDTDEQALSRFLDRINQRLLDMGLTDTHLDNPDGWGVPGHYSSAYDLAAFTMYALRYPRFVRTFSTGTYETADGEYVFKNNNRMLRTFEGIVGGKTGYDDDAGWCLVNVAERDGRRLIAVTMNGVAPDDWYDDNRVLLEYGFEQMALRAAGEAAPTAEFVRYRDPDAAKILAMSSASGSMGKALTAAPAADALAPTLAIGNPGTERGAGAVEIVSADDSAPTLSLAPRPGAGVNGGAVLAAAGVAATLILLQAASTWRLLSPRRLALEQGPIDTMLSPAEMTPERAAPASD
jgi:D-alanyl-D-alanine carboxypeptidase